MKSIKEVYSEVEQDLQKYIESSYHLHNPRLLRERRRLMDEQEISTEPWVEATPSYESGDELRELELPDTVVDLLKDLEDDGLNIFDPPYQHQANALESFFHDEKDLVVSTGTGSGKTEIFLYSILGQLAQESARDVSTDQRGIRTLILYPMNALVADQLSRMRLMFGDPQGADTLENYMGRRVQFGMYTSRTPYHGEFDTDKNDRRVKPIIDKYRELKSENRELFNELHDKGRIPTKDLDGFRNYGGSKEDQFQTQPGDRELFTRQEMHSPNEYGGTPDILITNYSMLEYMLLRPIEQPLFEDTRKWLEEDEDNELTVVLDEAHLYRGAQGAEVALLMSRLLQKLRIPRERVRFILTSATMGESVETAAPEFAAQLTTADSDEFAVITGTQETFPKGEAGDGRSAQAFASIGYDLDEAAIRNLAAVRNWEELTTSNNEKVKQYLAEQLQEDPIFRQAHELLREDPERLSDLAEELFEDVDPELAREATGNLLYLSTEAKQTEIESLLPTRLHMFLKGLPALYACVDPHCEGRRVKDPDNDVLGRIYTNPHTSCPKCGGRVFELFSHRTCGAAYLRAYRRAGDANEPVFLWTDPESTEELDELHLLVEEPRSDPDPEHEHHRPLKETTQSRKLDISTGHLVDERLASERDSDEQITVWVPTEEPPEDDDPWSWTRCPACGIQERRNRSGRTKVSDLETKGEEPFANVVRSMFQIQPEAPMKDDLPNDGKKVLCFSDGRQKAARLARDLQQSVELDSFREVVADIIRQQDGELPLDRLFAEFAVYCRSNHIVFFDDQDERVTQDGVQYVGSRSHFEEIQQRLPDIAEQYGLESIDEIPDVEVCRREISEHPRKFDSVLLRSLGDPYFSIPAALIGYIRPLASVMEELKQQNDSFDSELLEAIIVESIRNACEERAFDEDISTIARNESRQYDYESKSDQGLTQPELIPEYIRNSVDRDISDEEWNSLRQSLLRTDPMLFEPMGTGRYVVNPAATTLQLRLEDGWYRCQGCRRFSVVSLDGACPHDGCNGTLEELSEDDIHMEARKSFLRDPPKQVVRGERDPFTLRSEEHSAQLSAKDVSEPFSKSEEYELLFQDILVGDTETEQPIDVLSCTTTMEVGIDIGSLTGVAMRTVPPGPENYEQRSGRAGRRGAGLSTIITFADNTPHESHHFRNPEKMIGAEGNEPIIYAGNQKIAERHINASLLARFFDPSDIESDADVFKSLGSTADFFDGDGRYSLPSFEVWLNERILGSKTNLVEELGKLLPEELGTDLGGNWRVDFVRRTAEQFLDDLQELQRRANWEETTDADDDLLSTLLDDAFLPTFSFPIDVCDFIVKSVDPDSGQSKTEYEMSRDLKQALSTYIPGREIVVDKKTFTSYGVYFKFAQDPVNRASGEDWDNLSWLNFCPRCETVYDQDENMESQEITCAVCGEEEVRSQRMFTPPAFAPEVDQSGSPEEGSSWQEERIYATPPKYPLTPTAQDEEGAEPMEAGKEFGPSTVGRLNNQQLMVANLGPDEEGFEICTQCGVVARTGEPGDSHNRPYPKDKRFLGSHDWDSTCSGGTIRTAFSHEFPSDLTLLRIPLDPPMEFVPNAEWSDSAARSLSEALVMGASRALGIEEGELEGGYRTRSAEVGPSPDTRGFIEIFLFDTTAGGAGFSTRVWEEFDDVLNETREILTECDCGSACHNCLRTYQNRHLHEILNRHLGMALLEYATTGKPPALDESRTEGLVSQLEQTLQLQEPDTTVVSSGRTRGEWTANLNGTSVTFGVRSCLREPRRDADRPMEMDISDYQLSNRLPEVAYELNERLT